jgi:hypothetical protein
MKEEEKEEPLRMLLGDKRDYIDKKEEVKHERRAALYKCYRCIPRRGKKN